MKYKHLVRSAQRTLAGHRRYLQFRYRVARGTWRKYRRHLFSRFKLRGRWITWLFAADHFWVRVGRLQWVGRDLFITLTYHEPAEEPSDEPGAAGGP